MIEQGNRVAVEEDAGVHRVASADDERPAADGAGARHPGQVLHHLERVALRACGLREFGGAQAGVTKLLAIALAFHRRFQTGGEFALDAVDDFQPLVVGELLAGNEAEVAGRRDHDFKLARWEVVERKAAFGVGKGRALQRRYGDLDAGELFRVPLSSTVPDRPAFASVAAMRTSNICFSLSARRNAA